MSHLANVFVLAVLLPNALAAQPVAKSVNEIQQMLKRGQAVVVTDAEGTTIKGTITDLSDSALVLRVHKQAAEEGSLAREPQPLSWDTLRTIQRTDRRWNGALVGIWAGVAATIGWRAGCDDLFRSRLSDHGDVRVCRGTATGPGALYLLPLGAALGFLIDDRIGHERIAVRRGARRRVVLSPALSPRGFGLVAAIELKP